MLNRLFNTLFGKLFAGFCLVILLTAGPCRAVGRRLDGRLLGPEPAERGHRPH